MIEGNKLVTVKNIESSGIYSMMSEIFASIAQVYSPIMVYQIDLKKIGLLVFKKRKREYLRATRHLAFFGKKSTLEIQKESNEYGMTEMVTFLNGFTGIDEGVIKRFLDLAHHSPESFLSACMQVLNVNGSDWSVHSSGASEALHRFTKLMEEKLRGYKK